MSIINNKIHFLHNHLTEINSIEIDGKNGGFENFLTKLKIKNTGQNWNEDHSQVNWSEIENHYQFFFDFEDNENVIIDWLKKSELIKYEYLITWLNWDDPIVKIKTKEFIENWEEVYIASVEGMILVTPDGKLILEFTDDFKYNLNSNFEIKPNSKKNKPIC
jgi:hypothetical protein